MKIIQITPADPYYKDMIALRKALLWDAFNLPVDPDITRRDEKDLLFVAIDKDRVIGSVILRLSSLPPRASQLAVDKAYQKRGVGRKLMEKVEKAAIKVKINPLSLYAHPGSYLFYKKLGYEEVGSWFCENAALQTIHMQKKLS
ncbi:MAG: GNAT family N-acetyltransferase [Lactobacillales bacterium]|jgi:GNAT superfamily N-acetyltransferase|nr:GNAT family N-acetyltransferase [Lactobacillales bacterium]